MPIINLTEVPEKTIRQHSQYTPRINMVDLSGLYELDDQLLGDIISEIIFFDYAISDQDKDRINVEVEEMVVTLSGTVEDQSSKTFAFINALSIYGVVDVVDNITLKANSETKPKKKGGENGKNNN